MKALIISLNFNPGHVSHLVASYKQCEELGYKAMLYVNEAFRRFIPSDCNMTSSSESLPSADMAIVTFPSLKNLPLIIQLRRQHTKVIYIFHEPLAPMATYREANMSWMQIAKVLLAHCINALTVNLCHTVLLPSKKAVSYYKANCMYRNSNNHYLPLLYTDERTEENATTLRQYFSYIGTIATDHAFSEFVDFVRWAVKNNRMPELRFMIATKSSFEPDNTLSNSERVTIIQGHPLTDAEINKCYASSYMVWNAYGRTTQSGVLAKSFMFGTPAISLRKNLNEFSNHKQEVYAIDNNKDFNQIESAAIDIQQNFEKYSSKCRNRFLCNFYYKNYNSTFKNILSF